MGTGATGPRRWGGLPGVAITLVAITIVLTGLLDLTLPRQPEVFTELAFMPRHDQQLNGRRIGGLLRHDADDDLGVILGLSSVRDGIDGAVLSGADTGDRRWLVLGTGGQSFRQLEYVARPLLQTRRRPAAVLVCVSEAWLAQTDAEGMRRGKWIAGHAPGQDLLWAWRNRNGMAVLARHGLDRARARLMLGLGLDADAIYGVADPDATLFETRAGRESEAWWSGQLHEWDERGWFDPTRYVRDSAEAIALTGLLAGLRDMGAHVTVVMMPGSETWRSRMPPSAFRTLRELVTGELGADRILDLRGLLPDDQMHDHAHPNAAGRQQLSRTLGEWAAHNLE